MSDSDASIIDFLAHHPSSTTGDLAKRLNLDPEHIATRLSRLTATGEIHRAPHGYGT
jgi:DNA-binding MarR family transcriptional regulator